MSRRSKLYHFVGLNLILATAAGCGGSSNHKPVAAVGKDQTVKVGSMVVIDGTASRDPDGDKIAFTWSMAAPAGSKAKLDDTHASAASFTADVEGAYTVSLVVFDGSYSSSASQAHVAATRDNVAPVAEAGQDRTVKVG